eukprot:s225_g49.t1
MAEQKVRTHLFEKKKEKKKTEGEEGKKTENESKQMTPERKTIDFADADEEMAEQDEETAEQKERATSKHVTAKRIWGKKGHATSSALYQIAATPHRALKETALSIQMKNELEQLKAAGASSTDQMSNQQEALQQQVQKLSDIAHRQDNEIDDLRGMTDYTHELVMERECKESSLKMILKAWPKEATYHDRIRVTNWLLQRAQVENQTKQEHGYYSGGRRFILSPVTVLTFQDQDAQQTFEKFAYTNFSGKYPLHYWDSQGNRLQHWTGGWHKIIITNYLGKVDLTINMALTTALHILTSQRQRSSCAHRPRRPY